ncbi:MAG: hypothetical protein A3J48_00040 [Candidatus Doudnabacteria bacterium RIFCSPHIGHO2_02_FULL_46_11]|uniref:Transcriptional regulator n=1 Tax=Candidatus Doudnabacteria bacterium RIFCSPHIGHO2_02_FULL_46_11 TaxID=1817832 RepID=A0A1F5P975_9BACT|nr:MAG: hypothetical protein A3J48_00040 [Candidatus Doudnabacteria bacterium RIFCSPHIGHO2_02_FULL_46_11]
MKAIIKNKAINRLKKIEGQVRGLQKMVESDIYCIDIIHQSLAVKSALSSFEDQILQNHLATHVLHQMKSGKEHNAVKEIVDIYKLSKKK